jgi:PqqD family protein of HPr-rel-A system
LQQDQASTSGPAESDNEGAGRLQQWRVAGDKPLKWRCWAGDYVVFSPLSGQTHFLDIFAGHVLELIMAGTPSISELRSEAARFLEVEPDDRLAQAVEELLRRLEEVGLIEPAE